MRILVLTKQASSPDTCFARVENDSEYMELRIFYSFVRLLPVLLQF